MPVVATSDAELVITTVGNFRKEKATVDKATEECPRPAFVRELHPLSRKLLATPHSYLFWSTPLSIH